MIIACPECHVNYKLDPALLGAEGRRVLCTECKQSWFQTHVEQRDIASIMSNTAEDDFDAPQTDTVQDSFEEILKKTAATVTPKQNVPEAVLPGPIVKVQAKKTVYKSMHMGALQFGALSFLCCSFLTLIILFLGKSAIVSYWPPADLLYRSIGLTVPAPGEGLRLGALTAENRVKKGSRTLVLQAELVNMTHAEASYPALQVTLSSAYGAPLKTWTLDNKDAKPLAPGETVAVNLEFKDAPEGATDVEIKVAHR